MTFFGSCITPSDFDPNGPEPLNVESLRSAATVYTGGIDRKLLTRDLSEHLKPMLRMTPGLWHMFPTETTTNFDAVDDVYEKARFAGYRVYFNVVNPPAWATGGKGAYICEVGGSSCQVLAQSGMPRGRWADVCKLIEAHDDDTAESTLSAALFFLEANSPGVNLTDTPEKIAWRFVKNYRGEQDCALAWNDPLDPSAGVHVWGDPAHAEADKLSAPRPWQLSADVFPHADPKAMEYMGRIVGERYCDAELHGYGNEPDIDLSFPPSRFDGVNTNGIGPNTFNWLVDEQIVPYLRAVRAAVRGALLTDARPMLTGPDVAYAPTLPRFTRRAAMMDLINVWTGHTYDDDASNGYQHATSYAAQAAGMMQSHMISEIEKPNIVEWTAGLLGRKLGGAGVLFYRNSRFVDDFDHGGINVNATGVEMTKLIAGLQGKQRAVRG